MKDVVPWLIIINAHTGAVAHESEVMAYESMWKCEQNLPLPLIQHPEKDLLWVLVCRELRKSPVPNYQHTDF